MTLRTGDKIEYVDEYGNPQTGTVTLVQKAAPATRTDGTVAGIHPEVIFVLDPLGHEVDVQLDLRINRYFQNL